MIIPPHRNVRHWHVQCKTVQYCEVTYTSPVKEMKCSTVQCKVFSRVTNVQHMHYSEVKEVKCSAVQ